MNQADRTLAGLALDMTAEQARAVNANLVVDKSPTEEIWWLSAKKVGFVNVFDGKAARIVIKQTSEGATARGLSVSDPLAKVLDLYGAPQKDAAGKYWYTAADDSFSLMLMFNPDQTVSSITLGVGAPSK